MSKPKSKAVRAEGKISAAAPSTTSLDGEVASSERTRRGLRSAGWLRVAVAEYARFDQAVRSAAAEHAASLLHREVRYDGDADAATIELLLACGDDENFERLRRCFDHRVSAADDGVLDILLLFIRYAADAIYRNSESSFDLLRDAAVALRDGARARGERIAACRRAVASTLTVVSALSESSAPARVRRLLHVSAIHTRLVRELSGYDARFARLDADRVRDLLADAAGSAASADSYVQARPVLAQLMCRCGAFDVVDVREAQAEIDDARRAEKQALRREQAKPKARRRRTAE